MRIAPRPTATTQRLRAVAELAAAFAPSKERHLETTAQGRAFLEATRAAWPCAALDRLPAAWDGADRLSGRGRRCRPPATASRSSRRCTPILHAVTANLDLRRRAARPARPDRRPARARRARAGGRGDRAARARDRARRRRRRRVPRRHRKHAARDPVHEAVPVMSDDDIHARSRCASASAARSAPARPR